MQILSTGRQISQFYNWTDYQVQFIQINCDWNASMTLNSSILGIWLTI